MAAVRALAVLAYPLLVFAGLQRFDARTLALAIGVLFVVRLVVQALAGDAASRELVGRMAAPGLAIAALLVLSVASNDPFYLLALPVGINLALLLAFARTLAVGPSMVETLARRSNPDLPPEEVVYCRAVTAIWCAFFVGNAIAALCFALFASLALWTLYTGLISYLLMGTLFLCELIYRTWRFGRLFGTPIDPLLRWLVPKTSAS